jgi:hypothetical protein
MGRETMRIIHQDFTGTILFRVARAVLPEAVLLALFGRRVPVVADRRFRR